MKFAYLLRLTAAFLLFFQFTNTLQAKEKVLIIEMIEENEIENLIYDPSWIHPHGLAVKRILDQSQHFEGEVVQSHVFDMEFWDYIDERLKSEKIRFVNASFALMMRPFNVCSHTCQDGDERLRWRAMVKRLSDLVENNPQTLFIASAGNGLQNIPSSMRPDNNIGVPIDDSNRTAMTPASLELSNVISVGALNTDRIEKDKLDQYRMSRFSNFGLLRTDLFAPGEFGEDKGTSFAAPKLFVYLDALYPWVKEADHQDIRRALNRTVHVPKPSALSELSLRQQIQVVNAPVRVRSHFFAESPHYIAARSGGFVNPFRLEVLGQKLNQGLDLEKALEKTYRQEGHSEQSYFELRLNWMRRQL